MIGPGDSVCVVGGGWLGLTVALRLAEAGAAVTVFESAPSLGGLASAWSLPLGNETEPVVWDRYYHVTLESDAAIRRLLTDLDLDREIAWTETSTGYYSNGQLVGVSTPREFLALPGLSLVAKARLAATIAWGSRVKNWRALERRSVEAWLTRWSGRDTFERFWIPLLESKLGDAWKQANAAFIWATIQRLTAARRAGIGAEQFGAVRGGYARVLDVMSAALVQRGVVIEAGHAVERVTPAAGRVRVARDGRIDDFDHVVVTTTPRAAAQLIDELAPVTRSRYESIQYQGVVCASLVLRRGLAPYYLTYLMDELPFTAIVEMTNMIPPGWVGGHSLVYLPRYCRADDAWFRSTDEQIIEEFVGGLERVHPGVAADVLGARVARTAEVFPLPTIGYSERVPPTATGVPGISLVSSAQIVNGTLNVNETVGCAERGVRSLLGESPAAS